MAVPPRLPSMSLCTKPAAVPAPRLPHARPWMPPHRPASAEKRRFSGAQRVPRADVWLARETLRGLEPDGCLVRRPNSRNHAQENRDASAAQVGDGVCQAARNGKTLSKVV